ncbi:MAG TPA: FHA domain-containing protein [Gemmatimonadales bacterium]|nr:FHA domain-containing protein [Gemmatimonadales bacterium]
MPYLKLIELATQHATEVRGIVARLGRSPECAVVFTGEHAGVVSTFHAELRHGAAGWEVKDLGSRNGTFLNDRRLTARAVVRVGDVIGLGETGPRLSVAAVVEAVVPTVPERPGITAAGPPRHTPPEARAYGVTLLNAATGRRHEARGVRIRLGRGRECEVQPVESSDVIVSRVHAELTVGPTGALVIRDLGSTNGTFVNDERVTEPIPVRLGDRILLGQRGPLLIVEGLGTAPQIPVARPPLGQKTVRALIRDAIAQAKKERQQGRRSSTALLKAVAAQVGKDQGRKIHWLTGLVILLVLLLGGAVYGVYSVLSRQVKETEQQRHSAEDSARAQTERLRQELAAARAGAAPAAQVESLRARLESAQARTAEVRAALDRAQAALTAQLAAGEQRRLAAQHEVQRLREALAAAERRAPSQATIDSLRRAVTAAEQQTQGLDAKMRAIRATDFASLAQQNQGAVGLVTVSFGREYYSGTGFVITSDGYLLTNWHVVADSLHLRPDTVWVIMADQAQARLADLIALSQERDVAILKLRSYQGPYITAIDWNGLRARQGEPAALIGYPAGSGFARLRSAVVRTSMTAGIISRATDDVIQFDGMTIGGSSGSPLFNANGEVIAIHRAGLPQAPGFALSVPIKHAIPLMPLSLRQKLGF